MTRRTTTLPLLIAVLAVGMLLGVVLDRGGKFLSAQAARPPRPEPAAPRAVTGEALYQQLERQYEQFQHVNRTFELVARAVSPCVVHIVASKTGRSEDSPRVRHYEETGSGVIVRSDRGKGLYVLTNNHVIEGATPAKVSIFLQDGRVLHPDRYWLDAKADIGVLNLGRDDLPAARLGNSDEIAVGNWVLALGSPFGLTHSVSQGIISARGRHMDELADVENQDFLQTDAAINPGNSGGPLVNMKGEVIGINNSIASNGGGNEGVGFSIPINLARWIMDELIAHGHVSRGALGIDLHPEFKPEDAVTLGLFRPRGAWVDVVHPGSPAAEGGLLGNDVIVRFNGDEVQDLNHLINLVSMAPIGQPADVVVWRGGKEVPLRVKVGDRDRTIALASPPAERGTSRGGFLKRPERPHATSSFALGLELMTLDASNARGLHLPGGLSGAVVTKITPDSPLSAALKANDVLSAIDGRAVTTAEEAAQVLNDRAELKALVLEFERAVKGGIEHRTVRFP